MPGAPHQRNGATPPVLRKERAWLRNRGGSVLVEQKIDRLVADGRITPRQGEMRKEAARKSYEALQAKLTELSVKDVTVKVTERESKPPADACGKKLEN